MTLNVLQIKKQVRDAECKNESAATLWLVALLSGLDESIINIEDVDIQRLSRAGYIKRDGESLAISLESIEVQDVKDAQIEEYRSIFKGLFTGSMGSPEGVKDKLTRWLISNPKYTFEDVLKAAKYWVSNKSKEVDSPNLIGQADYFIYKKQGKDELSRLSSVIEEALSNTSTDDWEHNLI